MQYGNLAAARTIAICDSGTATCSIGWRSQRSSGMLLQEPFRVGLRLRWGAVEPCRRRGISQTTPKTDKGKAAAPRNPCISHPGARTEWEPTPRPVCVSRALNDCACWHPFCIARAAAGRTSPRTLRCRHINSPAWEAKSRCNCRCLALEAGRGSRSGEGSPTASNVQALFVEAAAFGRSLRCVGLCRRPDRLASQSPLRRCLWLVRLCDRDLTASAATTSSGAATSRSRAANVKALFAPRHHENKPAV
jgi:hypothetical protein